MTPQEILERRLAQEQARVQVLEGMIEDKTREIFLANRELHDAHRFLSEVQRAMPGALLVVDEAGRIIECNQAAWELLALGEAELEDKPGWADVAPDLPLAPCARQEHLWRRSDEVCFPVLTSISALDHDAAGHRAYVVVGQDLREHKRLEAELRQAQKLESVGQLAAGIAHEINTPMQFIGDSVYFLNEAWGDVWTLVSGLREACAQARGGQTPNFAALEGALEAADLDFLDEEVPQAFERTLEGVRRVAQMVSATRAFAHPDSGQKAPVDINACIETTLTVACNEYKYVAQVSCELAELPKVPGFAGQLSQVLLNLIVNAAHAITDRRQGQPPSSHEGKIALRTCLDGPGVRIEVEDNGSGIPEAVQHRIFDPFFTTKEVGRGTGQGLSICYDTVVDKHGGRLSFRTQPGEGTVFEVWLPLGTEAAAAGELAS